MRQGAPAEDPRVVPAVVPPSWASAFLLGGLAACLLSAFVSAAVAVLVVPLLDLTPLIVLGVLFLSRRWSGVSHVAMRVCGWLSAAMLLEGAVGLPLVFMMVREPAPAFADALRTAFSMTWLVYPAQLVALLLVYGYATIASVVGVMRVRGAAGVQPVA